MWHEVVFKSYVLIIRITLILTILLYGLLIINDSNDSVIFVILTMTLVTMNHW